MMLRFKKVYLIGIFLGLGILVANFLLFFNFSEPIGPTVRWFYPILILALTIGWSQFWYDYLKELKRQKRISVKFLDFVRNMGSAVKSGVSIPSAIIQASKKDYGDLDPFLNKLSNQIKLGIPIHQALVTFAEDTKNETIKRSITIVIEAESSGGDIQNVLQSITESLVSVKKLQEERKSSTYSQIVQGYIVYFVFIAIMLVLQIKLFPKLAEMGATGGGDMMGLGMMGGGSNGGAVNLDNVFFGLVMIQGFFAGIMIGKFSDGSIKEGLIHSLILITMGALIVTTIKGGI